MAQMLGMAGGIVQGIGQIMGGIASYNSYRYMRNMENRNAEQVRAATAAQEEQQRRDAYRRMGQTRAAYGASGVDLDGGAPLEVLADNAMQAELDALTIRYQGNEQAAEHKVKAKIYSRAGSGALMGGIFSGVGSILAASSSVANQQPSVNS